MSDFAQFSIDLDAAFSRKVEGRIAQATRWIALEALRRVVQKTPVDTGRARANWQTAIGVRPDGVVEATDTDGAGTIGEGLRELGGLPAYATVYIVNNLEYAQTLEDGRSDQAPAGMVAVTVSEIAEFFREIRPEDDLR